MDIKDVRGDESRRDAVHATEVHPFYGQASGQLNHTGFGSIVLNQLVRYTVAFVLLDSNILQLVSGEHSQVSR